MTERMLHVNHFSFLQKEYTPPFFLFSYEKQKRIFEDWGIGTYEEKMISSSLFREETGLDAIHEGWADEKWMTENDADTFTLTQYDISTLENRLQQEDFSSLQLTYESLQQCDTPQIPFEIAEHEVFAEECDYAFLLYVHALIHHMKQQQERFGQTVFTF